LEPLVFEPDVSTRLYRAILISPGALPTTVVLKYAVDGTSALRTEYVALRFLLEHASTGLGPRVYGYDQDVDLLVLEDLGPSVGRHLGSLLLEPNFREVEPALVAHMRALGHLHGTTLGAARSYGALAEEVGLAPISRHRVHRVVDDLRALPDRLVRAGFDGESVGPHVDILVRELENPGPFHCLTHGDGTFANGLLIDGQVRLFDFETAAPRHALIDGAFATTRYLHSVWAAELPLELRRRMESAYRVALEEHCEAARDDAQYQLAAEAGGAAWVAAQIAYIAEVIEVDQTWGLSSARARILSACGDFAERWPASPLSPRLNRLQDSLRQKWGNPSLSQYPAFSGVPLPG